MTPYAPPNVLHDGPTTATLTLQQARVLDGLILGLPNATIGRNLWLTEDTIKTHVRRIVAALGARNRTHAVALVTLGRVKVTVTPR